MEHLLFHCPWSRAVWFGSGKAFWVYQKEIVAVDKWLEDLLCGDMAKETSKEEVGSILQICWAIWKARNKFVFNGEKPNPAVVIEQAYQANSDYLFAVCSENKKALSRPVRVTKWAPPPPSVIKINVDGAFKSSRSLAAFGMIARDSGGRVQLGRCGRVLVASTLAIEAWALRIACVTAKEQGYNEVVFESDCQALVNYINGSQMDYPWEIAVFVDDIRGWAKSEAWSSSGVDERPTLQPIG